MTTTSDSLRGRMLFEPRNNFRTKIKSHYSLFNRLLNIGSEQTSFGLPTIPTDTGAKFVTLYDKTGPVLVRNEYEDCWTYLHNAYDDWIRTNRVDTVHVVYGQPSSGKTLFGQLLICHLISQRTPILYAWSNSDWFYFDGKDLWQIDKKTMTQNALANMLRDHKKVDQEKKEKTKIPWIVFDSRDITPQTHNIDFLECYGQTSIPKIFTEDGHAFVVFCSSPTESRWQLGQHGCNVKIHCMDPFNVQELKQVCDVRHKNKDWPIFDVDADWDPSGDKLCLHPLQTRSTDEAEQEFKDWGPCPRLQIPPDSDMYTQWKESIKEEIEKKPQSELLSWVRGLYLTKQGSSGVAHGIFVERRAPNELRLKSMRRIEGVEVESLIEDRMIRFLQSDADHFYDALLSFRGCEAAAGWFFELRTIAYFNAEPGSRHTIYKMEKTGQTFRKGSLQQDFITQKKGKIAFQANRKLDMQAEVLYIPESRNFVGVDCFFKRGSELWLFQITRANRYSQVSTKTEETLVNIFSTGLPEDLSNWNFVFVTPYDKSDLEVKSSSLTGTFKNSGKYQLLLDVPLKYGC